MVCLVLWLPWNSLSLPRCAVRLALMSPNNGYFPRFIKSGLYRESDGQAVHGDGEGRELDRARGLRRRPRVLGDKVVDENESLRLGKLLPRAGMAPLPERQEGVWLGGHLRREARKLASSFHVGDGLDDRSSIYLESGGIEFLRLREQVRVVVDVPEQRHHLPPFGYAVACMNMTSHFRHPLAAGRKVQRKDRGVAGKQREGKYPLMLPSYSTSSTASLKVNEMMEANR